MRETQSPIILDLFCGEGGAGMGYHRAGFAVFGVDTDVARLAAYPFPSHQGDALEFLVEHGDEFDAIHASPPCTGYSRGTIAIADRLERYDRLIEATRELLIETGKPYVIENVMGAKAELRNPVMLCGRMFGLGAIDDDGTPLVLDRHRLFESSVALLVPPHPKHGSEQVAGVYGGARRDKWEARYERKGGYVPPSLDVLRALVDAPWMTEKGCFLSIPPVYTEHIGAQLLAHLEAGGRGRHHQHAEGASIVSTETTIRVTCDHCGVVHYQGLQQDRPKHAHVTFWRGDIGWDPEDLCEPCAGNFLVMVSEFGHAARDEAEVAS